MNTLLALLLCAVVIRIISSAYFSKDKSMLFTPIVFIAIYFSYYVIYPYFFSKGDIYGLDSSFGVTRLLIATIINLIAALVGFNLSHPKKYLKSNSMFTVADSKYIAIIISIIGFVSYVSFKGLSFQIVSDDEMFDAAEHRFGHTESYITTLISLFSPAACLFFASNSKKIYNLILFFVAITIGILGGSRVKILLFIIPFFVFVHLYPIPKKINLWVWGPVLVIFVVAMGIIEKTRNYGSGLDATLLNELSIKNYDDVKAGESEFVYYYSAKTLEAYKNTSPKIFEIVGTAICMPIPRAIFPNKPDGQYLRDANIKTLGTDSYGAAYLNVVEGYLALGWLGVILNGLMLGLLSRFFWNNYRKHSDTIGGCLYLALFDAVSYVFISRGYLAQEFYVFMYYIPIVWLICKIVIKTKKIIA